MRLLDAYPRAALLVWEQTALLSTGVSACSSTVRFSQDRLSDAREQSAGGMIEWEPIAHVRLCQQKYDSVG
jgi:hypothetical protein